MERLFRVSASLSFLAGIALWTYAFVPAAGATCSSAFSTLRRPSTPLETSWGGFQGAGSRGPGALRANPASLGNCPDRMFAVGHQVWSAEMQQQWAGGLVQIGPGGAAFEVAATHAGDLPAYDPDGVQIGSFRPLEGIVGLGYGMSIASRIRVGASIHGLYLSGGGERLTGTGFGLGVEGDLLGVSLGLAARNFGADARGDLGAYPLPSEVAAGVSAQIGTVCFSVTSTVDRDRSFCGSGGCLWEATPALAFFGGMAVRSDEIEHPILPGGGVQIALGTLGFSYAYQPQTDGFAIHHVSLRFIP
jgi:hypothetical protein